jgi:hypothetical protein
MLLEIDISGALESRSREEVMKQYALLFGLRAELRVDDQNSEVPATGFGLPIGPRT